MSDKFEVTLNGQTQEVTLADLAGMDISGIEENAGDFFRCPKGKYRFQVKNASFDKFGDDPVVKIDAIIVHCFGIIAEDATPEMAEALVGKECNFPFFMKDVAAGIGKVKYLMAHSGFTGVPGGDFTAQLDGFCGTVFDVIITHGKNKNDPDKPYVNFDMKSITPPAVA